MRSLWCCLVDTVLQSGDLRCTDHSKFSETIWQPSFEILKKRWVKVIGYFLNKHYFLLFLGTTHWDLCQFLCMMLLKPSRQTLKKQKRLCRRYWRIHSLIIINSHLNWITLVILLNIQTVLCILQSFFTLPHTLRILTGIMHKWGRNNIKLNLVMEFKCTRVTSLWHQHARA